MVVEFQIPSRAPRADCALTVLLADGDDAFTSSLLPHLDRHGLQVTRASTARAAWQWSLGQSFDVIVLDRDLPDGDALGLVALLRDHGNHTPVVALAAVPDVNHAFALGRLGISAYLKKPVALAEFVESIRRAAGPARGASVAPVDDIVAWLVSTLAEIQGEQRVAEAGTAGTEPPLNCAPDLVAHLTSGRLNLVEFLTASELLRCHLRRLTPAPEIAPDDEATSRQELERFGVRVDQVGSRHSAISRCGGPLQPSW